MNEPSTFDFTFIKTVPSTYSWDQGVPATFLGFKDLVSSLSACSAVSVNNEEGVEYVGYAPFVFVALSSEPGWISDSHLALRRTANFGDYYNSETNVTVLPDLENVEFCHVYIMPGLYTITLERNEYIQVEIQKFPGQGLCIQKYCIDWSFKTLKDCPLEHPVTWGSTKTGGRFQKTWKYEPCEEDWAWNKGLYIQTTEKEPRFPLSWQWFNFLKQSPSPYNESITWLSAGFQAGNQLTWKETVGPCVSMDLTRSVTWKWELISCSGDPFHKQITWNDAKQKSPYGTTWNYTKDNCEGSTIPMLSTGVQTITRKASVRVLEIPPTTYLTVKQPTDRYTPLTVRLSPKDTICGSFPIERIVWDLGDGSPLLTQRRWSNTLEEPFIFSGSVSDDFQDPRNYDVIHTYTKTLTSKSCFYPSITAYASSTNTSDSAAATVGPLIMPKNPKQLFTLLQNELTDNGKVMIGQIDDNISVWKAETKIKELITIKYLFNYLGYWSADSALINNVSKLYMTRYSNSIPVKMLSGEGDIDKEGNLDVWRTDEEGTVTWDMIIFYPYSHVGFYSNDEVLTKKVSKIYASQGSAATVVAEASGYGVDIDLDGNEDTWNTDANGIITWETSIVHPYTNFGYYTNVEFLTSQSDGIQMWYGPYSSAALVANLSGIADVNRDGNLDTWIADRKGYLSWSMVLAHPHPRFNYLSGGTLIDIERPRENAKIAEGIVPQNVTLSGAKTFFNTFGTAVATVLSGGAFTNVTDFQPRSDVKSVIYYSTNTSLLDTMVKRASSTAFYTNDNQVIVAVLSGSTPSFYYSNDDEVINGTTIAWREQGTGSTRVYNVSGSGTDINEDGNDDFWYTNGSGIVSFYMISAYPYRHFGFYSADQQLVNRSSKLFLSQGTGSLPLTLEGGVADVDGDGNNDTWSTDSDGVLTYAKLIVHPRFHFGYYSDDITLVSEHSVLWNGNGTAATVAANVSGIADIFKNGNTYNYYTNNAGTITFNQIIAHPYLQLGMYYSDEQTPINGYTILWDGIGTGAAPVPNLRGNADLDGDGKEDLWNTNSIGRLSWVRRYTHVYPQFDGYYGDTEFLINGTSKLWDDDERFANVIASLSGIADVERDGNNDTWKTNAEGIITWAMISAHPYQALGYYIDTASISSGNTVLWNHIGTGATRVSNVSGIYDFNGDGNSEYWSTNENGIVSFATISAHPYAHFNGYYSEDQLLINGTSILWSGWGTGAIAITSTNGTNDVNADGNEDIWSTDAEGRISWNTIILHPYINNTGYYTDVEGLTSGISVLWSSTGTGATKVSNINGVAELDGDNNNDSWTTNGEGIVTWAMISAHPYTNLGYFTDTETLTSGSSVLWNNKGTGATIVSGISGEFDIDGDGGNELWTTNSQGIITFSTISAHQYSHFGYYADEETLIKEYSVLWNDWKTNATIVSSVTGITDIDGDGFNDLWSTDEHGVITWTMIPVIGNYWFSTTSTNWYDISSWYVDSMMISRANTLPTSATDVVILTGGVIPYVNIDSNLWTSPRSINAIGTGITFYSKLLAGVTSELSGYPITFLGNSRYGISNDENTKYWFSSTDTDWNSVNNWYRDPNRTLSTNILPTSSTNVIILSGGLTPFINLDDPLWSEPLSINATAANITFYSEISASIKCSLFGMITFLGNSRFGP